VLEETKTLDEDTFEIFLTVQPGLEDVLAQEANEAGFTTSSVVPGGVLLSGGRQDVWRANLTLRGTGRVLLRIAEFRAMHLAQLDKRARKVAWKTILRPDVPVRVEATCRASRIYHNKAAAQRVARAINEELGAPLEVKAPVRVLVRIEDDLCTISLDTSGAPLHQRGLKQAVSKAPMRETLAALFLRQCGYDGREPVADPMCGSGTFVLEAADMATGCLPGRARHFAFEHFANFDSAIWNEMKGTSPVRETDFNFLGSDRDQGAIKFAMANAERAGHADRCTFRVAAIRDAEPPEGPAGLVIVNPPYGARIGNKKMLYGLYAALGDVLKTRFTGWRVGIVTSENGLARATGLPLKPPGPPIDHGGVKIRLHQAGPLT
jgi:putative N6-adenine-specific DNA methylase